MSRFARAHGSGHFSPVDGAWCVALGLAGFFGSSLAINTRAEGISISFDWAGAFALLAALGFGARGAALAGIFGLGAFYPFLLWPNNGYGNVATSLLQLTCLLSHGYAASRHRITPHWYTQPLLVQLPNSALHAATIYWLYPYLLAANPAPWCGVCVTGMSDTIRATIAAKTLIAHFFSVAVATTLLMTNPLRRQLGLPMRTYAAGNGRILLTSLAIGAGLWGVILFLTITFRGEALSSAWAQPLTGPQLMTAITLAFGSVLSATAVMTLNERLRMSHFELEQSRRLDAVGRLAGGVAHDFNNMLSVILGAADLIELDEPLSETGKQNLAAIQLAATRSRDLTRELLDLTRKSDRAVESIDLHRLLEATSKLLRHSLSQKIELQLALAAGKPHVRGNATQLQGALLNLGMNASHAMPDGGQLRFETRLLSAERVEVSVIDTGSGIAPEHLPHVFEPFFTTKPQGQGTGLGLAMVYATVKSLRGEIRVVSEPGRGTRMILLLPVSADY